MKRSVSILSFVMLLLAGSAFGDTPGLISYQGKLYDNLGNTVANGNYSVTFTLYDAPAAGNSKWTETQVVATSGGQFSVNLGSISAIEDTVFNGPDRYLGIQVEADPEMTPRTVITSAAYAQRVSTIDGTSGGFITGPVGMNATSNGNALEVYQLGDGRAGLFLNSSVLSTDAALQATTIGSGPGGSFYSDGGGPGISAGATGGLAAEFNGAVNTYGDEVVFDFSDTVMHVDASLGKLSTFGSDGLEQIRLWGNSYGEVLLHDNTDNDITARLAATNNEGGLLTLADGDGNFWIELNGGNADDASVMLPNRAINALECLDEPGVANRTSSGFTSLTGIDDTLLVRTITAPAAGWVLAIATASVYVYHNEGIAGWTSLRVGPTGGNDITVPVQIGHATPDATWMIPATVQGIFAVPAGATQFSVVGAKGEFVNASVENPQLTLIYFATNHGVTTSNITAGADSGPNDAIGEKTYSEQASQQQMMNEIATLRERVDALQAKLDAPEQDQQEEVR